MIRQFEELRATVLQQAGAITSLCQNNGLQIKGSLQDVEFRSGFVLIHFENKHCPECQNEKYCLVLEEELFEDTSIGLANRVAKFVTDQLNTMSEAKPQQRRFTLLKGGK